VVSRWTGAESEEVSRSTRGERSRRSGRPRSIEDAAPLMESGPASSSRTRTGNQDARGRASLEGHPPLSILSKVQGLRAGGVTRRPVVVSRSPGLAQSARPRVAGPLHQALADRTRSSRGGGGGARRVSSRGLAVRQGGAPRRESAAGPGEGRKLGHTGLSMLDVPRVRRRGSSSGGDPTYPGRQCRCRASVRAECRPTPRAEMVCAGAINAERPDSEVDAPW